MICYITCRYLYLSSPFLQGAWRGRWGPDSCAPSTDDRWEWQSELPHCDDKDTVWQRKCVHYPPAAWMYPCLLVQHHMTSTQVITMCIVDTYTFKYMVHNKCTTEYYTCTYTTVCATLHESACLCLWTAHYGCAHSTCLCVQYNFGTYVLLRRYM